MTAGILDPEDQRLYDALAAYSAASALLLGRKERVADGETARNYQAAQAAMLAEISRFDARHIAKE